MKGNLGLAKREIKAGGLITVNFGADGISSDEIYFYPEGLSLVDQVILGYPKGTVLVRNDERYPPSERQIKENPKRIIICGSREQVENFIKRLSSNEPGCDDYYYIEGEDE